MPQYYQSGAMTAGLNYLILFCFGFFIAAKPLFWWNILHIMVSILFCVLLIFIFTCTTLSSNRKKSYTVDAPGSCLSELQVDKCYGVHD